MKRTETRAGTLPSSTGPSPLLTTSSSLVDFSSTRVESAEVVEWEEEEGAEVGVGLVERLTTSTKARMTF